MLREFLECEVTEVISCNEAKTKAYADHYTSIRQNLSLPAAFVAARYRTRIMRHFYSYKERKGLEFDWSEAGWKRLSQTPAAIPPNGIVNPGRGPTALTTRFA
jgi:hypothetical protein